MVVDTQQQLMHMFGDAQNFIRFPEGAITRDISRLVPRSLALPLNTAFHRAQKESGTVSYTGIQVSEDPKQPLYDVRVSYESPTHSTQPYYLVVIKPEDRTASDALVMDFDPEAQAAQRISDLEHELQQTRENLQATIEELETTNEEQQATNEELVAANEELQSANEELHSVNEELHTVNAEYQAKIQELTETTNDIDNLLKSAELGVIFLDEEFRIRRYTDAALRAVSLVPTDIGRDFTDLQHRLNYPELIEDMRRVLSVGHVLHREATLPDGSYVMVGVHPYQTSSRVTEGVVLTFMDIGELKRTESALRAMSDRYACLFDSHLIGIAILEDTEVIEANQTWLEMHGYRQDALPLPVGAVRTESDSGRGLSDTLGHADNSHAPFLTIDALHRNGHTFPAVVGHAVLDAERRSVVEFSLDASAQKNAETELARRAEELERVNMELQDFAYSASHDLQEPLRMVSSYVELLEQRFSDQLGAEGKELLHFATDGAERMRGLVRGLLEFSRVQTRGQPLEAVSLDEVMDHTLAIMQPDVEASGATIKRVPLPVVNGDARQLSTLFEHLLSNAFKYAGEAPPMVDISTVVTNDQAVISVRDNGIGIDPRFHERIFTIFQRLHTSDEYPGDGLGLALCQRIVERHGGSISVDSQLGHGAEFKVTLPLATGQ